MERKEDSPLELLFRNISPNLACEIKQCWIDPETLTLGTFLGKGNKHKLQNMIVSCRWIMGTIGKVENVNSSMIITDCGKHTN